MPEIPINPVPDPIGNNGDALGRRVLVLAPFGRDAAEICHLLSNSGVHGLACADMAAVCREIQNGAAAVVLAEEALNAESRARLSSTLAEESTWSDFPVLVMTSRSRDDGNEWQVLRGIEGTAYLTLLERPLHTATLVSAVRTAIHARERQYEVRDALSAREKAEQGLRDLNRTLEHRVQERTADLEARNRELQNFAHVASHDLREPLRKIQTFAGLVQEEAGDKLSEDTLLFLERMSAAAVRMDGLLHDLLAFSRVATHIAPSTPVRLDEIVTDVLKDYELTIQNTAAEVVVDADVTIEADRPQLRQLLANLIGNAFKFRHAESAARIRIHARVDSEDNEALPEAPGPVCRISVEDEGVGFDPKFARRIFEPYERLHGQGSYEGTGMGLAICQRIVQLHGGTIHAESTPGEGSRFVILLPVNQKGGVSDADNSESDS